MTNVFWETKEKLVIETRETTGPQAWSLVVSDGKCYYREQDQWVDVEWCSIPPEVRKTIEDFAAAEAQYVRVLRLAMEFK